MIQAGFLLAEQASPWNSVWDHYVEAPNLYPEIPNQIRKSDPPPAQGLFDDNSGWPQWNENQEADLLSDLRSVVDKPEQESGDIVVQANSKHEDRRKLVWAELRFSPLAMSIEHLAKLAELMSEPLAGGAAEKK